MLPRSNKEIIIIKQGGKVPTFDENSRQTFKCMWEEVEHMYCVDHAPVTRGTEADTTTTHDLESNRQTEVFYFSMHNQSHYCDINIKHGYYIVQRTGVGCNYGECPDNVGWLMWKVVASRQYEIMPGCWDFKITGERLAGRESEQLLVECAPYIKQLEGIIAHEHD